MPLECVDDGDGDAGHFCGDAAEGGLGEECGGADLYGAEVEALGLDGREGEEGVGERGVCALGGEGNAAWSAYIVFYHDIVTFHAHNARHVFMMNEILRLTMRSFFCSSFFNVAQICSMGFKSGE